MIHRPFAATSLTALALAASAVASFAQRPAATTAAPVRSAAETITPRDLYARIEFLSSDLMRGRDTPSPELNLAASYLVSEYKLWGFAPAGENGTFYQWWPFPQRRLQGSAARMEVVGPRGTRALRFGSDFFSAGGTVEDLSAGMVFVGTAAHGTLAEGTLRERVAVAVLPGNFTAGWRRERNRQRNAVRAAGARAIIHVLDDAWTADSVAAQARTSQAAARAMGTGPGFPQFFVTRAAAREMLAGAGLRLDDLVTRSLAPRFAPVAIPGLTARGGLPLETLDEGLAPNVVAMLPGSDPVLRNEYVVLSAHMDHVGVGRPDASGDSIYNGADDDASGTSGLLEVAQAMAALPEAMRPRRSVVFLHVSGEEKGLLGSEWYSDHPTLPLPQIVANINVDMIGRNSPDSVVVIGKTYSTLGESANRLGRTHPELRLTLADDIWPEERFFFRSDHYNFARKEVPSIFFFSGVHEDYHRPSDEVETIDTDKAARITRMVFYLTYNVANATERPKWDPRGLEEVRGMTR